MMKVLSLLRLFSLMILCGSVRDTEGDYEDKMLVNDASLVAVNSTAKSQEHMIGVVDATASVIDTAMWILNSPAVSLGKSANFVKGSVVDEPLKAKTKDKDQAKLWEQFQQASLNPEILAARHANFAPEEAAKLARDLEKVLDFKSSETAFNNAAETEKRFLESKAALGASPPASREECEARFDAAMTSLDSIYCKDGKQSTESCISNLKVDRDQNALAQQLEKLQADICSSWQGWISQLEKPTVDSLAPLWPRYVSKAAEEARILLLQDFASPASVALGIQQQIAKEAKAIYDSCVAGSSWYNPLGKLASAIRETSLTNSARHINSLKAERLRGFINQVTCPAVKDALCKGGCDPDGICNDFFFDAEEDFQAEAPVEPWQARFQPEYCAQMTSFYHSIQAVCGNPDAILSQTSSKIQRVIDILFDASSVQGLAGIAILSTMWMDPNSALDIGNVAVLLGTVRSATYLVGRFIEGWQDQSKFCMRTALDASGIEEVDSTKSKE